MQTWTINQSQKNPPESRSFWLEPIKRSEHCGSADSGWVTLSTSKSLESSVLFPKERRGEERRGEGRRGDTHNLHYTTLHFLHNTGFVFIIMTRRRVVRTADITAFVRCQQTLLALNMNINNAGFWICLWSNKEPVCLSVCLDTYLNNRSSDPLHTCCWGLEYVQCGIWCRLCAACSIAACLHGSARLKPDSHVIRLTLACRDNSL